MRADDLLQAFRLTNPGEFHRQLVKIQEKADKGDYDSQKFLNQLSDLLTASKRTPLSHAH